jgi:hypothetical protein
MSSACVTSQATASDRPPARSMSRAVSWLPSAATSATTTFAPLCAKARAVARPMPLVAPVMKRDLACEAPVLLGVDRGLPLCVVALGHGRRSTLIASR